MSPSSSVKGRKTGSYFIFDFHLQFAVANILKLTCAVLRKSQQVTRTYLFAVVWQAATSHLFSICLVAECLCIHAAKQSNDSENWFALRLCFFWQAWTVAKHWIPGIMACKKVTYITTSNQINQGLILGTTWVIVFNDYFHWRSTSVSCWVQFCHQFKLNQGSLPGTAHRSGTWTRGFFPHQSVKSKRNLLSIHCVQSVQPWMF